MAQPDKNRFYRANTGEAEKMGKNNFNLNNLIFKIHNKADKEEERLLESQMHPVIETITTGKETGGEIVQYIKLNKITSLEENKTNNSVASNKPASKYTNRKIERNQTCEQNIYRIPHEKNYANNNTCIRRIQNIVKDRSCIRLHIILNGVRVKAILDTGSPISIISVKDVQKIKPTIYRELNNTATCTEFNGNAVKLTGEIETNTRYGDKSLTKTWKVIEGSKEPIKGMDNIPKLGIEIFTGGESLQINRISEKKTKN